MLEQKLKRMKGVADATVNVVGEKVTVEFDPSIVTVEKIRDIVQDGKG